MLSLLVFGRSSKITYRMKKRNYFYFPILFSMCFYIYPYIYILISHIFQVKMRDSLVSLLQTVRLIYSVSRYYNTSERTSSLMIKITNQMIVACRDYVTNRGRETVWGQDRAVARSKLKHCLKLNK